jgi:hypothetical protein
MIGSIRTPALDNPEVIDGLKVEDSLVVAEFALRRLEAHPGAFRRAATQAAPPRTPGGSSPKALYPGCEFCPSIGGGCIVCQDWD